MRKSLKLAISTLRDRIDSLELQEKELTKRGDKILAKATAEKRARYLSAYFTLSEALESWPIQTPAASSDQIKNP